MKFLIAAALLLVALPCAAQAPITPSQTRLIGCFGEAFTLVEHVWRIAPAHLDYLTQRAAQPPDSEARRQFLAGVVAGAIAADQTSAMAMVRNLDGCMTEATEQTMPDATTAILATALRTELDSALEDVADLIKSAAAERSVLQQAVGSQATDRSLDTPLETYLSFGDRVKMELLRLRARADALIAASTPGARPNARGR